MVQDLSLRLGLYKEQKFLVNLFAGFASMRQDHPLDHEAYIFHSVDIDIQSSLVFLEYLALSLQAVDD